MIKELLLALASGEYVSKPELAVKLGKPLALVDAALDELVRLGFVERDDGPADCELPCGGCPYASMCNRVSLSTLAITAKGWQALSQ
ncbi:MAG: helix-turn-helix domain-containing protein [Limnochordia bacterium]|jgi:predicted transcriptional regulator